MQLIQTVPSSAAPIDKQQFLVFARDANPLLQRRLNLTGAELDSLASQWLEYRSSLYGAPLHGWPLANAMRMALCEWYCLLGGSILLDDLLRSIWVNYRDGVITLRGSGIPAHRDLKKQYPNGWELFEEYANMDVAREKLAHWQGEIERIRKEKGIVARSCATPDGLPTAPVGLDERVF